MSLKMPRTETQAQKWIPKPARYVDSLFVVAKELQPVIVDTDVTTKIGSEKEQYSGFGRAQQQQQQKNTRG